MPIFKPIILNEAEVILEGKRSKVPSNVKVYIADQITKLIGRIVRLDFEMSIGGDFGLKLGFNATFEDGTKKKSSDMVKSGELKQSDLNKVTKKIDKYLKKHWDEYDDGEISKITFTDSNVPKTIRMEAVIDSILNSIINE